MGHAVLAVLARQRSIVVTALVCLSVLAWCWLLTGAGMPLDPLFSLSPASADMAGMPGMTMEASAWSWPRFALILAMWWVMMVAMMLPSAAPMILLHARAASHSGALPRYASECFLAGYLAVWGGFSLLASVLQLLFERNALLSPMAMASASPWLSVVVLLLAGVYQFSPLKNVCLRQCRNPAQFLSRSFLPGNSGSVRMGLIHGAYCVGCCWPLMTLLFVGGVMNLAWIALLTLVVAAEKLLPFRRIIPVVTGLALISWSLTLLLRSSQLG